MHPRRSQLLYGLALILVFEIFLSWITLPSPFGLASLAASLILAVCVWQARTRNAPGAWASFGLAALMLLRAILQTGSGAPIGVLATYVFPVGFILVGIAALREAPSSRIGTVGVALVALGRSWFALWYLFTGNTAVSCRAPPNDQASDEAAAA